MEKNHNNPGVLKMIQDCPRRKKKAEDRKRRKGANSNVTRNTSSMNTDITQEAITAFHTSKPDKNSITTQVQMPRMGRQRGVNAVATKNGVSVTGLVISKLFSMQYDDSCSISIIGVSKFTTINLYVYSNNYTKHDG